MRSDIWLESEDERFNCQFSFGKLYGDDQFLNWSLPQPTGLWHLDGFESLSEC